MRQVDSFADAVRSVMLWLAVPALALTTAVRSDAQVEAVREGMTSEDVARIRSVTDVEIAPNGETIAFLRSEPRTPFDGDDGRAWTELYVMSAAPEGQHHERPFVTGEVTVSSPRWSTDSNAVYFLQERDDDEHRALYRIPVDGGEAKKVLEHEGADVRSYSLSPTGDAVAYLARVAYSEAEEELRDSGFDQEIYEEGVRDVELFVQTFGSEDEPRQIALEGSVSQVHWSPAGGQLLVAVAPTPLIDQEYMRRWLAVIDLESGEVAGTVQIEAKLGQVAWSPDGKLIAAVTGQDIHDTAPGRLKVASAPSGKLTEILAPDDGGHVSRVAWTENARLVFTQSRGVWSTLDAVAADGSGRSTLIAEGGPIWRDLSVADDGSMALVGSSPAHPSEAFIVSSTGRELGASTAPAERWTDSNAWLAERQLAEQTVVRYPARDGLEIEGMLIRPLGVSPDSRTPLILTAHGGPESHYSNGWLTSYSMAGQLGAARGFSVFYPNYRGSTGRGVEFAMSSQADPAGKEFDDLVDGVDYLVAQGWVDKDKVGITGSSYGGYATAWGSTYYTERFAAGVMFVGISNEISKIGTTDIPEEMFLVHMRHWPWDDWQFFLERSPIYYVEKARTPLLILHGKEDPRVYPGQSMELYRFLKIINKTPVRLVLYPGEGHGNRRAASRYDYNLRMLRWMEHYLMGAGGEPPQYELEYPLAPAEDEDDSPSGAE